MDPMIFQFIGASIDGALDAYVNTVAGNVIAEFIPTAILMTSMYYVLIGGMIAIGKIEAPAPALFLSALRFVFLAALAFNANIYLTWIVDALRGLETGLAAMFAGTNGTAPDTVYGVVDGALGKGWGLAGDLWEKAGNRGWNVSMALGEYAEAIVIALATGIIGFPAGAMIVAAKAMLALMLGIGPLFVACLMWPVAKPLFDRWVGLVLTAIVQIALLAAVLAFAIGMFGQVVDSIDLDSTTDSPFFSALRLIGFTVVMLWLLYRVNDLAAQLGGAFSTAAITFGQLARGAVAPVTGAARVVNRQSTRRDLSTGHMVTAGRLNHIAAGNTALNPAYRQHFLESIGKNWGRPNGGRIANG